MLKLIEIFKNFFAKDTVIQQPDNKNVNSIKLIKSWYEEKHDNLIVQRNLLFLVFVISLILSICAVVVSLMVVSAKKYDPFVIQIDQVSGVAKVVNPISSEVLQGNDALARYFIKKYVIARETYNPVDFETEARKTIRLLSTSEIFWNYIGYIKNKDIDPTIIYGQKNTTFLLVKSWSKLDKTKYMLRFSINETSGAKKVFNRIAVVEFDYIPIELTEEDRDINPVGFQIKGYRVDDDNS